MYLMSLFLFFSCGQDPILDRVDEMSAPKKQDLSSKKPSPSNDQPKAGVDSPPAKEEPKKGDPQASTGPEIRVTGTIEVPNYVGGIIRLNVSDGDQSLQNGPRPNVLRVEFIKKPGPFQIKVPAMDRQIYIDAFNDSDKNGSPGSNEPKGALKTPLNGNVDHSDIRLTLTSPTAE